ncbi:hypothetical protein Fot_12146 [Forsythia ovata]|uniref:Uncharacterized protein n=1 Tax=Forsythia ovata TaxID=205694 RepID=A0ABD1WLP9_9LAMI
MYRSSRDNWVRLVEAVLRREQLSETALDDSWSLSTASASNSHYSLSSSLPRLNMMEDMRSNGGRQANTEPKTKDARSRIKQQIIQVKAYFKTTKLRNKEKSVFDKIVFIEGCNLC